MVTCHYGLFGSLVWGWGFRVLDCRVYVGYEVCWGLHFLVQFVRSGVVVLMLVGCDFGCG